MLDQLQSALEMFATATKQTQDAFEDYQAEATKNLARFQEVHTNVVAMIKDDWAKMSNDLTEYTWKSYLNLFGDIARHYGNLTDYFTRSSDAAIVKQDQALERADLVTHALDISVSTAQDLVHQQAVYHQMASENNAELLNDQAKLQARSEFLLGLMDMINCLLTEEVDKLEMVVNNTNDLRDFIKESTPLIALLTPLSDAARLASISAHALMYIDLLTLVCVVTNGLTFVFVGKRVMRYAVLSLAAVLRVFVAMRQSFWSPVDVFAKQSRRGSVLPPPHELVAGRCWQLFLARSSLEDLWWTCPSLLLGRRFRFSHSATVRADDGSSPPRSGSCGGRHALWTSYATRYSITVGQASYLCESYQL